jgi:RNA polymerase sigma-70 factor (ECF subfamily)
MTQKKIEKLVKSAQMGEKEALEALYNHFFNQIYYYVYSRINNVHDAQEIVSEVFLSMVEGITKFKGDSSFKNYLFGICKNKIRDFIRNKYKASDYVLQSNFAENSFDNLTSEDVDYTYKNKLRDLLKHIYKLMKPRYAKVLDLRFNKMNSIDETAAILGISENNVKVIQHRAIKQANAIWEKLNENNNGKFL